MVEVFHICKHLRLYRRPKDTAQTLLDFLMHSSPRSSIMNVKNLPEILKLPFQFGSAMFINCPAQSPISFNGS